MPNSNSSTSLYSFTNTVKVSANNFTTLYNATPSEVNVANVSDRNFTTLYNKQAEIGPTRSYGNSNVEAFLNAGSDQGGNVVHNINADGTITANNITATFNLTVPEISGSVNFPLPQQITIPGGGPNYFLTTDGGGHLNWTEPQPQFGNAIPYIHFDVYADANNQTFTTPNLVLYTSNVEMNVMKNGVNIEPDLFSITGNVLTINTPLTVGDTIDVLSTQAGAGGNPGGTQYAVQYNDGANGFYGDVNGLAYAPYSGLFNPYIYGVSALKTNHLIVDGNVILGNLSSPSTGGYVTATGNVNIGGYVTSNLGAGLGSLTVGNYFGGNANVFLGNVANVHIEGGTANYLLQTDGLGNLTWVSPAATTPTSLNATIANVRISGGLNGYVLQTDGTGNLTWTAQTGGGGGNGVPGGSNTQIQYNDSGNFAGASGFTFDNSTGNNVVTMANLTINPGKIYTNTSNVGAPLPYGPNDRITLYDMGGGQQNYAIGVASGELWNSIPYNDAGTKFSWHAANINIANLKGDGSFNVLGDISAPSVSLTYGSYSGNGSGIFNIPGTAIISDVANANYANYAGNAFSVNGANVIGIVPEAEQANTANIADVALYMTGPNVSGPVNEALQANVVVDNNQPNITSVGTLANLTVSGFVDFSTSPNVTLPTVNSVFMAGGNLYDVLTTNGSGNLSWAPPSSAPGGNVNEIQFNYSGLLGGTPNLTYDSATGNLSGTFNTVTVDNSLINTGDVTVQRAFEKYTPNATGLTGTFNYDVIDQSIVNITANAIANATVNFRGNSSTTLDSMLAVNQAITLVLVSRVGATAYIVNGVQVDGTTVFPKYLNGTGPTVGTRLANALQSYTYTIMKSAANTFTVLGSLAEFQ